MSVQPTAEQATNLAAGAAVASPVALPWIETVSDTAAIWLPILGAAWLILQIVNKLTNWKP